MSEIKIPDIGDFERVDVIEVLVHPGDTIAVDDPLLTLESDKASMDVPAPLSGRVMDVLVAVGDKVSEGTAILVVEEGGGPGDLPEPAEPGSGAAEPTAGKSPAPAVSEELSSRPELPAPQRAAPAGALHEPVDHQAFKNAHASPALRRFARELGVDLAQVKGTGRKGRILREDVQDYVKNALAGAGKAGKPAPAGTMGIEPIPAQDFTKFGEIEEQPLSRIKKISGAHLHRCWLNVPMVTFDEEADITEMEAFRQALKPEAEKRGVRVTGLAFITKALGAALQAFPTFNASLSADGASLILKKYVNVGIAVDTPNGLVVPVIRDVDKKGIYEISADMAAMSKKAREGKLTPTDMSGGCMSISSLGGIGGVGFTPLVNAPEVAILGLTRAAMKPVWNGKEFVPRLMQPLHVTFDHRVIDGAEAARFTVHLGQLLTDLKRLVL